MVLMKNLKGAKIRLARRLDHLNFFDALTQKDDRVFDSKNSELETVLQPIVTNKLDVSQDFVALNKVFDFVVVVLSQNRSKAFS